ncbi:MAG TPA: hypothetical protein VMA13_01225 [Candidatus Saccharimonadales bacterium]|nr:hypothetical protein [Candidatus Saccharimonadales bacterium]
MIAAGAATAGGRADLPVRQAAVRFMIAANFRYFYVSNQNSY